jgi:hypothetical protein
MPTLDMILPVTGWELEVIEDDQNLYMLRFISGALMVEAALDENDLDNLATSIELALAKADDIIDPWDALPPFSGALTLRMRLGLDGMAVTAPHAAQDQVIPFWTLNMDDVDGSSAEMHLCRADVGALLYEIRVLLDPQTHLRTLLPGDRPLGRLPRELATRFLAIVAEELRTQEETHSSSLQ